jgi:hypothetical protein
MSPLNISVLYIGAAVTGFLFGAIMLALAMAADKLHRRRSLTRLYRRNTEEVLGKSFERKR